LTAAEISKPEFCGAFTGELERLYPKPIPQIEPSPSRSSISSLRWIGPAVQPRLPPPPPPLTLDADFDLRSTAQRLLHRLRLTSAGSFPDHRPSNPRRCCGTRNSWRIDCVVGVGEEGVERPVGGEGARFQYDLHGLATMRGGGGGRGSEDSQVTAVPNHRWTLVGAEGAAAVGGSGSHPISSSSRGGVVGSQGFQRRAFRTRCGDDENGDGEETESGRYEEYHGQVDVVVEAKDDASTDRKGPGGWRGNGPPRLKRRRPVF
jgi:hypothetical protein